MERKAMVAGGRKGLGARMVLAALGGLAAMVAGVNNMFHADHSTTGKRARVGAKRSHKNNPAGSKPMGRGRNWTGAYGNNLMAAFNRRPSKGRFA